MDEWTDVGWALYALHQGWGHLCREKSSGLRVTTLGINVTKTDKLPMLKNLNNVWANIELALHIQTSVNI